MNRRTINTVIIIGILSIISILIVQITWVKSTVYVQKNAMILQQRQDSINNQRFDKSVRIALRSVLEEIRMCDSISIEYGAVRQEDKGFFLVKVNEALQVYYLEKLLERSFDANNVHRSFQFRLYNCYSDTVKGGQFVEYTKDSLYVAAPTPDDLIVPSIRRKIDGHYFTVFFPSVSAPFNKELVIRKYPWVYLVIIVILLLIFFAYAISVIIQQKRMADIRSDFVNNMTHELKTPISAIGLSSDVLNKLDFSKEGGRAKQYAGLIYKENKRLERLVERVLNASLLNQEEMELKKEETDIHQLIDGVVEQFILHYSTINLSIKRNFNAKDPLVYLDVLHITSVVTNLLDNAVKYTHRDPEIIISTENKKEGVQISFQDNGIGIKKSDINQIFDQFFRINTGNRHDVKGFGIGLFYVQSVIVKHLGNIDVSSKLDKGSTFKIWLPQKEEE